MQGAAENQLADVATLLKEHLYNTIQYNGHVLKQLLFWILLGDQLVHKSVDGFRMRCQELKQLEAREIAGFL